MDFLTAAILSSAVYDILKHGASITGVSIKKKLSRWAISEQLSDSLSCELNKLGITDSMSEKSIEADISQLVEIRKIIDCINKSASSVTIVTQHHSGSGDNVGRDKINS